MTVPAGVTTPGATGLTVAVNVTDWPNTDGFTDEVKVVVVPSCATISVRMGEVPARKLPSVA